MALVNCPECQGEVSDQAAACPHCGHPMAGHQTDQTQKAPAKPKVNSRFKTGSIVGLIGGLGMIALLAYAAYNSATNPSKSTDTVTIKFEPTSETLAGIGIIAVILVAVICLVALIAGNKMSRTPKLILSGISLALSAYALFSMLIYSNFLGICFFFVILWQPILEVIGSIMMVSGAMKSNE